MESNGIPKVLATDLDGTLIPLDGNGQNVADLERLSRHLNEHQIQLVFVTGRHLASVLGAIDDYRLPCPQWMICDVGTSIYERDEAGEYQLSSGYTDCLAKIAKDCSPTFLIDALRSVSGLRLQEAEKQGLFKLSFYTKGADLRPIAEQVRALLLSLALPYSVVASTDPFTGDGLIDLLPCEVSKAFAIDWWTKQQGLLATDVLYAGDSGNDSAVFAAGYASIVVANASTDVLDHAQQCHAQRGWSERLYAAPFPATSGVLAGLQHFTSRAF